MTAINNITNILRDTAQNNLKLSTPTQMMQKINSIALPLIALAALGNIPGADGGPWAMAACLIACVPLSSAPPLLAICIAACGGALVAPTP